ncbi:hypothetical protein OIU76_021617 [Salix suchowensis]|nr:hypothetical protein OIU76_021617 [Salix suchowensis]
MHEPRLKLFTTSMESCGNFGLFAWTLSLMLMEPRTSLTLTIYHTNTMEVRDIYPRSTTGHLWQHLQGTGTAVLHTLLLVLDEDRLESHEGDRAEENMGLGISIGKPISNF